MSYNWEDIKEASNGSTGYMNLFSDTEFETSCYLRDKTPYIELFLWNNTIGEDIFQEKSYTVLYDLITELYSEPDYSTNHGYELTTKYKELFKIQNENSTPLNIWQTSTNNIVLLKIRNNIYKADTYLIHVEPNIE